MHTLTIIPQAPPAAAPNLDMGDVVARIARVTPKQGEPFVVCNRMDELIEARESGEPFIAHSVVAMKAKRVIIEPGTIARIEEL